MRLGGYDYETYSCLAGPPVDPGPGYRVGYRSLISTEPHRARATLLMMLAPTLSAVLLCWLVWPDHWTRRNGGDWWLPPADAVMLVSIGLIELFRLVNVASVAHATLVARDPVPVLPEPGTRVAFLTTFVPGKEPMSMLRATLRAATRLRHHGPLDVWLLDEGDDADARALCAELGVRHFSRSGVARWNQPAGPHQARTKHGNYNAWLDAHGEEYDFFASVDTDHVPLPGFLERMLGYFRDPDIAFVVGPQVYGNYVEPVTKAAESQQFLFHALIQRAGNRYGCPMLVGTNNAVRISALKSIGGLKASVTEDMATGFELHRTANPATGNRWRSVYTPDVLAVGEGPSTWTDFFNQQLRWSRGTYETILGQVLRGPHRHRWGSRLNYGLMLAFYPMAGVTWVLGALGCVLYLALGASGTQVAASVWLMLYSDVAALQVGLYLWNRRHNVSPHEPEGSSGASGMLMSALCAPIYARSLLDAVLRRRSAFVVTPKGDSASPDRLGTFRLHLTWAGVLGGALLVSLPLGHTHVAMRTWASLALVVSLAPVVVWAVTSRIAWRPASRRPGPGVAGRHGWARVRWVRRPGVTGVGEPRPTGRTAGRTTGRALTAAGTGPRAGPPPSTPPPVLTPPPMPPLPPMPPMPPTAPVGAAPQGPPLGPPAGQADEPSPAPPAEPPGGTSAEQPAQTPVASPTGVET